jgi:hypothetical protein
MSTPLSIRILTLSVCPFLDASTIVVSGTFAKRHLIDSLLGFFDLFSANLKVGSIQVI